ncbi:AMP-binding protein [Amycolatopsis thermophila]|uniref:Crotonobetaine/carnitine-CoA ligase n=1 Tax=Amycolatopsis thermophila TaxID=206084 RepID=A0ABU0F577_9PSEU|nr:AMP-binding protein [Amycolatopsis thermophila]MDQ0382740.1 crotonobetaine/carnitine-CoA ligase [Amycolatopsis thermophila]
MNPSATTRLFVIRPLRCGDPAGGLHEGVWVSVAERTAWRERSADELPSAVDEMVPRYILERVAGATPDATAVLFEDGTEWTFRQALAAGHRAANALAGRGVGRGDRVLVFLPNGQDWLRAWFGATFLGAVVTPVNTAYKGDLLAHVCGDSGASVIVTDDGLRPRVDAVGLELDVVDGAGLADGSPEPVADPQLEPWDLHFINYTSGTTGASKGVATTYLHSCMASYHSFAVKVRPGDRVLVDLPLFHVGGQCPALAFWSCGQSIALREVFTASRWLDVVRETGATFAFLVGTMAGMVLSKPPRPGDAESPLRSVYISPVPSDPQRVVDRFGLEELYISMGSTEGGSIFVSAPDRPLRPGLLGRPRPGMEVAVADSHDQRVPAGQPGELLLRTDRPWEIIAEYWRNPVATAAAWRNGWFHTGDLVREDDGDFFFVDRVKDAIRRRGENVSNMEVEAQVAAYPEVAEVACVAGPSEFEGDDEVKVFVVVKDAAAFDPAKLIEFLLPRLPYFMVPRFVEVIDALPKTPTNKIRKAALRELGNSARTWDRAAAGIVVDRRS